MNNKEIVLDIIKKNPGIRKRYIAKELRTTVIGILSVMDELKNEGLIRSVYHNDPANLEFYDEWYAN